jgi:hypothetical protein
MVGMSKAATGHNCRQSGIRQSPAALSINPRIPAHLVRFGKRSHVTLTL